MKGLLNYLLPYKYGTRQMLLNYLRGQYGPYLTENPTDEFDGFYKSLLSYARPHVHEQTRALDVGCATGRLVFEYAKMGASCSTGTDSSRRFIDACNAIKNGTRKEVRYPVPSGSTRFLKDDICRTSLPSSSFEFVSCVNVVDRVSNPKLLIEVLENLLTAKGVMLLADPYDWEFSPAPKSLHTADMKSLLDAHVWNILEEIWIPFKVPISKRSHREYSCHLLVAQKTR